MKLKLSLKTLLVLILSTTSADTAFAETVQTGVTCRDALVSMIVNNVERVESTRLCLDLFTRPSGRSEVRAFASESCVKEKRAEQTCFAFKRAKEVSANNPTPTTKLIALPNFDLCLRLGGEPASVRFQIGGQSANRSSNQWQVSDRCLFDEDFSYLDLRSLAEFERSPFSKP